jgi:hypothetical protein
MDAVVVDTDGPVSGLLRPDDPLAAEAYHIVV